MKGNSLRTFTLALDRMVPCLLLASHWKTALSWSCRLVRLISLSEILPLKVLPGKTQTMSGAGGNTTTVEFTGSPRCLKVKGKAHLQDQTRTLLNSQRSSRALPLPAVPWPTDSAPERHFPVKTPHSYYSGGSNAAAPGSRTCHTVTSAYSEARRKTRSPQWR